MSSLSAIHSKESLLRLAFDGSPAGLIIADEKRRIVLVNQAAERLFGYEAEELLGQPIEILLSQSNRNASVLFCEQGQMELLEQQVTVEKYAIARRRDNTEFPVDISLHRIESEQGGLVLANILDATKRQGTELAQANHSAIERLILVGQLSGGVAHEIRTPLSVIRNDVYFLQSLGDRLGSDAHEAIQEICEALGKANRIVGELLDFTRQPVSHPAVVKLSRILEAALKSYRLPSSVKLSVAQSIKIFTVQAEVGQVERILINLLRNAVQAMSEKGTIEIQCDGDDQTVWMDVVDDGPGLSERDRNRVFDPLFTTKATGIGLGLAISLRYARSNRGDLTVCNRPMRGACFRLALPRGSQSIEANDHE